MNDDDFSGLVRSGSQHSVSVSEHTGNAKTPKNVVVSHEEETEARKRAFEEKALAEHTEDTALDAVETNIQKIAADQDAKNRQALPGRTAAAPNVQNVSTDVLDANVQSVGTDSIKDNIQSIGHGNLAANKQNIAAEKAIEANRQGIPTDVTAPNLQSLAKDDGVANDQKLTHLDAHSNQQPIDEDSFNPNRQALAPAPAITPNHQTVGTEDATSNRQAVPQDAPAGPNRQGVGQENITSHFEALPSGAVERKKVDFPTDASNTTAKAVTPLPKPQSSAKPAVKSDAAPRALMTPVEQQEAKLKRDKMMDEFHGRVAGIKHDVDVLNHRLSDFEEKVHKEDANLLKGASENFDTHRD